MNTDLTKIQSLPFSQFLLALPKSQYLEVLGHTPPNFQAGVTTLYDQVVDYTILNFPHITITKA